MTAVLVHGNPETAAVWDPLCNELKRRDVVAVSLPGFGVGTPNGWTATKEAYAEWLETELESVGEPVDLVGHDWGGGFVLRVASMRPDLVRSWVSDVAGFLSPNFEWHDLAKVWRTPGEGEKSVADMAEMPSELLAQAYQGMGISEPAALEFAEALDEEMGRCILALYRSADPADVAAWAGGEGGLTTRPGLVVAAADDPYTGGTGPAERQAEALGASCTVLDGLGHWWMQQDPARGARMLEAFWASANG